MRELLVLLALAAPVIGAAQGPNRLTAAEKKAGYVLLFDGKDLAGWEGNPALWSVKDGMIMGSTEGHPITHNTFLISKKEYSNFILQADIRLRNHNSGIQFRSVVLPEWVMTGYQADASDVGEKSGWGNLYEEKGRGRKLMKTQDEGWQKAKTIVHPGEWNSYEILAQGSHLQLKLNGVVTMDLQDEKAARGFIGFQLHLGPPMEVFFRNVKLKPLP